MTEKGFSKIVNFMTPKVGLVVIVCSDIGDKVKMQSSLLLCKGQSNWVMRSKEFHDHKVCDPGYKNYRRY